MYRLQQWRSCNSQLTFCILCDGDSGVVASIYHTLQTEAVEFENMLCGCIYQAAVWFGGSSALTTGQSVGNSYRPSADIWHPVCTSLHTRAHVCLSVQLHNSKTTQHPVCSSFHPHAYTYISYIVSRESWELQAILVQPCALDHVIHVVDLVCFPLGDGQSVVMSISVCLSARVCQKPHDWTSPNLLCMLPLPVTRSSADRVAVLQFCCFCL